MDINRFDTPTDLFQQTAAALETVGAEAVERRGVFHLVLSGGSTPGGLFEQMREEPYRGSPIWPRTIFWWGDERAVPPDAEGSNYRMARELLLDPLGIEDSQIRRMRGELDPAEAAARYNKTLLRAAAPGCSWPRFDLVLLGLGTDGHTASLFPGSMEPGSRAAFAATADYDGRPAERVSLTAAAINDARQVFWLVVGEEKGEIVARVLEGPRDPLNIPAHRIEPVDGEMVWWLSLGAG